MEHALGTVIPSGMGNLQYVPALVGTCLRQSRWQCPVLKMKDGGLLLSLKPQGSGMGPSTSSFGG